MLNRGLSPIIRCYLEGTPHLCTARLVHIEVCCYLNSYLNFMKIMNAGKVTRSENFTESFQGGLV